MNENFEMLRSERRSFFCSNKLWKELQIKTNNCTSVSLFIKKAILEKLIREEPKKAEYYKHLIRKKGLL